VRYAFTLLTVIGLLILAAPRTSSEHACAIDQGNLFNDVVTIEGHIEILNHPDLGKSPASLTAVIFQRVDCGKCLISARTDEKGDYKITVGRGRYRVIKQGSLDGGPPFIDMLAAKQPRYIDANSLQYGGNRFDIKIVLPAK
jgi:hypothetical protein